MKIMIRAALWALSMFLLLFSGEAQGVAVALLLLIAFELTCLCVLIEVVVEGDDE